MTATGLLYRVSVFVLALVSLAGCKLLNSPVSDAAIQSSSSAPSVWGDPETSVVVGTNYAFQPDAEDADGDVLVFSIVNKPGWATFDEASGMLQGVPAADAVGMYDSIVISVSDQSSIVSMPSFDIMVESSASDGFGGGSGGGSGAAPPTISGSPNTSALVDSAYSFRPSASDPDGDTLSFSIVNKPSWATFVTTTGRLHGTPRSANIGTSNPIQISVTDGSNVVALNQFSITVEAAGVTSHTVSWMPPTENEDGTPLMNLAGYRIYYGTASGDYSDVIELNNPGLTSFVVDNLTAGRYYLVMTSFTDTNLESAQTPEINFLTGS